jgi:hypothetical protein
MAVCCSQPMYAVEGYSAAQVILRFKKIPSKQLCAEKQIFVPTSRAD